MKRSSWFIAALAIIALGVWKLRSPVAGTDEPSGVETPVPVPAVAAGISPPDSPSTPPTPAISATPDEPGTEELRTVVRAVRAALPKKSELKPADDEAAHHVGPELIRAGQALGDLAEYLERRPEEFKAASIFYANCAADETLMPASRAVCYAALSKKKGQWAPGVAERISRVGPDILDIAKSLSD